MSLNVIIVVGPENDRNGVSNVLKKGFGYPIISIEDLINDTTSMSVECSMKELITKSIKKNKYGMKRGINMEQKKVEEKQENEIEEKKKIECLLCGITYYSHNGRCPHCDSKNYI